MELMNLRQTETFVVELSPDEVEIAMELKVIGVYVYLLLGFM
jgi:hypothetical protein